MAAGGWTELGLAPVLTSLWIVVVAVVAVVADTAPPAPNLPGPAAPSVFPSTAPTAAPDCNGFVYQPRVGATRCVSSCDGSSR